MRKAETRCPTHSYLVILLALVFVTGVAEAQTKKQAAFSDLMFGPPEPNDYCALKPLHEQAYRGDPSKVRALLDGGYDVNESIQVSKELKEKVLKELEEHGEKYLLEFGNLARDPDDFWENFFKVAESQIKLVQLESCNGATALHIAAGRGHGEIVNVLLEYGANVEAKTHHGIKPMDWAVGKNRTHIIRMLLDYGAKVQIGSSTLYSALHWAALFGCIDAAKVLLKNGAAPNAKANGMTPMDMALLGDKKNFVIQEMLTQHGGHCEKMCP